MSLYPTPHSQGRAVELTRPGAGLVARELARWRLFWRAIFDFDVIHFYFGETLLMPRRRPDLRSGKPPSPVEYLRRFYARLIWGQDLPVLKALGKRIAFSFLGDDVRLQEYSEQYEISIAKHVGPDYYPAGSDYWKKRLIGLTERYADAVFAYNPDLLNVLPRGAQLIPYSHLFPSPGQRRKPLTDFAPLRIAHAPTHFAAKGTDYVLDAVSDLRRQGYVFEFDLINGLPHAEAAAKIASSDLFVDQLLAGWYGGAAVEAMMSGTPAVAYIREADLQWVPPDMRRDLPLVQAKPENLAEVLAGLIDRGRPWLNQLGERSRAFAQKYHDPLAVARQVAAVFGPGVGEAGRCRS